MITLFLMPAVLRGAELAVTDQNGLIRAYANGPDEQRIVVKFAGEVKALNPVVKNVNGTLPDIQGREQPDGSWLFEGAQRGTWMIAGVSRDISLVEVRIIINGVEGGR